MCLFSLLHFFFIVLNYLLRGASCIYCGRRVARVSHGEPNPFVPDLSFGFPCLLFFLRERNRSSNISFLAKCLALMPSAWTVVCAHIRRVFISQLRYRFRTLSQHDAGFFFQLGWWKILAFSLTLRKCTIYHSFFVY